MADFGAQITNFAKNEAQNFAQKTVGNLVGELAGIGGGIINSLIGSVSRGLSQNLLDIGSAFDTIEAVASRKLDNIVAGGSDEFATGGKCLDRSTAADISAMRNPTGGTLKSYLTDVFPETKVRDKANGDDSHILTHDSDRYYMQMRFYSYERSDLFKPANSSNQKYQVVLPLPAELVDAQRANWQNENAGPVGNYMNNGLSAGTMAGAAMNLARGGSVSLSGALSGMASKEGASKALKRSVGFLAGVESIAGKAGINQDQIVNAVEQYLGVAPNPNPSMFFRGPSLREFNFSWIFNPRNPEESRRLKKTISRMKASSLPATEFGSDTGVLRYPHVVMVNFYPWDKGSDASNAYGWSEDSFLRIKRCAISGITADYAPTGAPTFFEGTKDPTFIRLNINLSEIEFFVSEDWGGAENNGQTLGGRFDDFLDGILEDQPQ